MGQIYINKSDREAAWTLFCIYKNAMESGGCLAFDKDDEEDLEAHEKLVNKIDSLIEKIR